MISCYNPRLTHDMIYRIGNIHEIEVLKAALNNLLRVISQESNYLCAEYSGLMRSWSKFGYLYSGNMLHAFPYILRHPPRQLATLETLVD